MAQMIPVFIDEDTKSTAGRKLFTMLRDMPDSVRGTLNGEDP